MAIQNEDFLLVNRAAAPFKTKFSTFVSDIVHVGADEPDAERVSAGSLWLDTTVADDPRLQIYDGAQWVETKAQIPEVPIVIIGEDPPTEKKQGDLWWDSVNGTLYLYYIEDDYNDGAGPGTAQWVEAAPGAGGGGGASIEIGQSPPTPAKEGDLWFNQDTGTLYIYYVDPSDDEYWIEVAAPGGGGGSGGANVTVSENAPATDDSTAGDLWYCTDDGRLYIYYDDGDSQQWVDASPPSTGGDGDGGGGGGDYTLPTATAIRLGGIKVGNNLTVEADGTLNADTQDGSAGTLQEVTDAGNTTTNNIVSGPEVLTATTEYGYISPGYIEVRGDDDLCLGIFDQNGDQPSISLNADGSATFDSNITTTDGYAYLTGENGYLSVFRTTNNADESLLRLSSTSFGNDVVNILADGRAAFAADLTVGNNTVTDNSTINIINDSGATVVGTRKTSYKNMAVGDAYLFSHSDNVCLLADTTTGEIRLAAGGDTEGVRIKKNSVTTFNNNITLDGSDGSATFAGFIDVGETGGNAASANPGVVLDSSDGGIYSFAKSDGTYALRVYNSTAITSSIKADGHGVFTGQLDILRSTGNSSKLTFTRTDASWSINNETGLRFYYETGDTTNPSNVAVNITNAGAVTCGGFTDGDVLQPGIVLDNNGSATFAGDITTFGNVNVNSGSIYLSTAGLISGGGLNINTGSAVINSDGSAIFSGFVDCTRDADPDFGYLGIGPGGVNEKAIFTNRSGEMVLEFYQNYSSSPTVEISSDGSANFASGVSIIRAAFNPVGDSDAFIQATNQTTDKVVCNMFGNGDIALGNDLVSETKIELKGSDGSAKLSSYLWIDRDIAASETALLIQTENNAGRCFEVAASGTTRVGGTMPGSPNISLNSNGAIETINRVGVLEGTDRNEQVALVYRGSSGASNGQIRFSTDGDGAGSGGDGLGDKFIFGKDKDDNVVFSVGNDGSASFSSGGHILYANGSTDLYRATSVATDGILTLHSDIGGTREEKVIITADGGANFASRVIVGDEPYAGANVGSKLEQGSCQATGAATNNDVWLGYVVGTAEETSRIGADGSADFASTVVVGSPDTLSDSGSGVRVIESGSVTSQRPSGQGTSSVFTGMLGDSGTSTIFADGSANFSQTVSVAQPSNSPAFSGVSNAASGDEGTLKLRQINANGALISGFGTNNTRTVQIKGDGSATFSGGIRAASLTDGITTKTMTDVLSDSAGAVLQVLSASTQDVFSTNNSLAYQAVPGLQVKITPTSASSKLLITVSIGILAGGANAASCIGIIKNGGLLDPGLGTGASGANVMFSYYDDRDTNQFATGSGQVMDTAGTTSEITYDVGLLSVYNNLVQINRRLADDTVSAISTLTIMEIA